MYIVHPLEADKKFNNCMGSINHTLVDRERCYMLYQFTDHVRSIHGDVAEVGVYKGGTAKLISLALQEKQIHLFDTFSGMPPTDPEKDPYHHEGNFSDTSLGEVKKHLADCHNVHFYPGLFPDTATPVAKKSFCFVHIDVDIYKSGMCCCEFFYPRMEPGGIMVFDDYGFKSTPGLKMAVDEYFSDKSSVAIYLPTGQAFVVKKTEGKRQRKWVWW